MARRGLFPEFSTDRSNTAGLFGSNSTPRETDRSELLINIHHANDSPVCCLTSANKQFLCLIENLRSLGFLICMAAKIQQPLTITFEVMVLLAYDISGTMKETRRVMASTTATTLKAIESIQR